jgi:Ferric uptake regulator family/Protocatechuate 3,4-dioxygenase beta subunit N terminal
MTTSVGEDTPIVLPDDPSFGPEVRVDYPGYRSTWRRVPRRPLVSLPEEFHTSTGPVFDEIAAEHRHHHVVCVECGAVVHVHDDAVRDALRRVTSESGYELADTELTFYGTCPSCATAPRASAPPS